MKDCRECKHALQQNFGTWLCCVEAIPKPTHLMRDHRSECGLAGALFDPKKDDKRYAEADQL